MTDTGADSVTASSEPADLAVYCYYASGTFANGTAVKADHPGKLYLGITTDYTVMTDCYDVETGGGSAGDCPGFFRSWRPDNTNKPVFYASLSVMSSVVNALTAAGIKRSEYYLWEADWDGAGTIPAGYDAAQYRNTTGYDLDVFSAYMWGPLTLPSPGGMKNSFYVTGAQLFTAWDAVDGIGSYHVQVESLEPTGWVLRENATTPVPNFDSMVFPQKTQLRWRVSTLNPNSAWSDWVTVETP